jgi:hypothetical protein
MGEEESIYMLQWMELLLNGMVAYIIAGVRSRDQRAVDRLRSETCDNMIQC